MSGFEEDVATERVNKIWRRNMEKVFNFCDWEHLKIYSGEDNDQREIEEGVSIRSQHGSNLVTISYTKSLSVCSFS